MPAPMMLNSARSSGELTLKWLVVPRQACSAMIATSITSTPAVVQLTIRLVFRHEPKYRNSHASVRL